MDRSVILGELVLADVAPFLGRRVAPEEIEADRAMLFLLLISGHLSARCMIIIAAGFLGHLEMKDER
jgi:hypothetical protein